MKQVPKITWLTSTALLFSFCVSLTLVGRTYAQNTDQDVTRTSRAQFEADYPALAKYAIDITKLARQRRRRTG